MTYLARYHSHPPNSPEQDAAVERIAQEIRTLGTPTSETMREMLKVRLAKCSACSRLGTDTIDAMPKRSLPG